MFRPTWFCCHKHGCKLSKCLVKNICFCCQSRDWKMSRHLVKKWFCAYKGLNAVSYSCHVLAAIMQLNAQILHMGLNFLTFFKPIFKPILWETRIVELDSIEACAQMNGYCGKNNIRGSTGFLELPKQNWRSSHACILQQGTDSESNMNLVQNFWVGPY